MYLGRVVGRVWATAKNASLEGQRMLVIQPLTPELRSTGKPLICLDSTGAGAGEIIYWVRGREASIALLPAEPPADTTVVGIVDTIHLRTPPQGVEAGETGAQAGTERVGTGPNGAQAAPRGVGTGPNGAQAGPNGVEAAPRGVQGEETGAQAAPRGVGTGPNGAQAGPNGVEAAPRGVQGGDTGAQAAPRGVGTGPNGAQAAPKEPAAPGSTRTPTHRKGRRC